MKQIFEENLIASFESHASLPPRSLLSKNSIGVLGKKCLDFEDRLSQIEVNDNITFPSTRFYGSKRRHLSWLRSELGALSGRTALDAFGGTGAVSHLLTSLGWQTTYNDIFEFNTISARAIFSQSTMKYSEVDLKRFLTSVEPKNGFIAETFDGIYFYREENKWLDGFMNNVVDESKETRCLLLYCLFQACLKKRPFNLFHRANLNLRGSKIPVQFGNRTTWNTPFIDHILTAYRELRRSQSRKSALIEVTNGMCARDVGGDFDLIYLDPPYFKQTKRNTDTYLQRYHFLEGLARYKEWPALIDKNSPQKVIAGPYRNEWTNKRDLVGQIEQLIHQHRDATFALSYVSDEEPTETELFELFGDYFDHVRMSRRSFNRVLSNKESFEILITGY